MKKINWGLMLMVVVILVMTVVGVYFMEEDWVEDMSALIWVIGMVCVTWLFTINEKRKLKMLEWSQNHNGKS